MNSALPVNDAALTAPSTVHQADPLSASVPAPSSVSSEIMLLPDGRLLAHHLTPELARLLAPWIEAARATDPQAVPIVP